MARPKMDTSELTRNNPRWRDFGEWVRSKRINNHITVKDAAKAMGITPKQFSRYEKGVCSVSPERVVKLARAIGMSRGRALMRAGYEARTMGIDPENELRWIWTYLESRDLYRAIQVVIELHFDLEDKNGRARARPNDGNVSTALTNAVAALEHLPGWLCEDLIRCVRSRQKRAEDSDLTLTSERQAEIRKQVKEALALSNVFSEKERKDLPPSN
jgi:transcriptional regulator with XRE-family HTH domain